MFVDAIDLAAKFTRSIHMISRNFGSDRVQAHAATLFFVNSEGWALTCAHVAKTFQAAEEILEKYAAFQKELAERQTQSNGTQFRKNLERKYEYSSKIPAELRYRFMNCIEGTLTVDCHIHPKSDVALLKFNSFEKLLCDTFPVFPKDTTGLKQGLSLCRLGFPFPEFTNFTYDSTNERIEWTSTGQSGSPRFPIEGMVTRHLLGGSGERTGFEISTPGLKGQSGGPAFDSEGKVWGMQSQTHHLDLDFDVDTKVLRGGIPKQVKESAFLHVGRCVDVDTLKSFMVENEVSFEEG